MKPKKTTCGCSKDVPPMLTHIRIYFNQKGQSPQDAEAFFKHYKTMDWKTKKGCPIKDWKAAANNWIWIHRRGKELTIEIKLKLQFPDKTF